MTSNRTRNHKNVNFSTLLSITKTVEHGPLFNVSWTGEGEQLYFEKYQQALIIVILQIKIAGLNALDSNTLIVQHM